MILNPSRESLKHCAGLIKKDELVAVPTETVYGLAGNALRESAVRKIFEVKGRPLIDPLIVHCPNYPSALDYIESNPLIKSLAEEFWPGPLTLIARKKAVIPDIVTAGLESVAIRVPAQKELLQLLELCGVPLAAPSANPFGYVSPTEAAHVERTLGGKLSAILDGGRCLHGVESTIIDVRNPNAPALLRYGPLDPAAIEKELQRPLQIQQKGRGEEKAQTAPGMLSKHYSPHAEVHLIEKGTTYDNAKLAGRRFAHVFLEKPNPMPEHPDCFWLTEDGCMETAARNLFALMQTLDAQAYRCLVFELAEETGIGLAFNDRLKRAAAK